jgi:hypothetical protein
MISKYKFLADNRNCVLRSVTKTHLTYGYKPLLHLPPLQPVAKCRKRDLSACFLQADRLLDGLRTLNQLHTFYGAESDAKKINCEQKGICDEEGRGISQEKSKGRPVTCHDWHREGGRGIAVLLLNLSARLGGQRHAPTALPSGKSRGTNYIGGW